MIWLLYKYNNTNQAVVRSYIKNLKNLSKKLHIKPQQTAVNTSLLHAIV